MIQTKRALVIALIAVVAIMAASTMMPKPVYAPGTCNGCGASSFAPGHQEGSAQNSAPGQVFGGGGAGGASAHAPGTVFRES